MVRTPHFHCRGPCFIPGQETKIPQVVWHGKKKWSYENKHNETDFKNKYFTHSSIHYFFDSINIICQKKKQFKSFLLQKTMFPESFF